MEPSTATEQPQQHDSVSQRITGLTTIVASMRGICTVVDITEKECSAPQEGHLDYLTRLRTGGNPPEYHYIHATWHTHNNGTKAGWQPPQLKELNGHNAWTAAFLQALALDCLQRQYPNGFDLTYEDWDRQPHSD